MGGKVTRTLFKKSRPENTRVRGELVRRLQRALTDKGFSVGTVDVIFGGDTEKAVKAWQSKNLLNEDGIVTFDSWVEITDKPAPTWRDRALQLTADFEGTGFGKIVGNFDGAWLTWGIVGFTLKHGELGTIIKRLKSDHPAVLQNAFGQRLATLLEVVDATPAKKEEFANSISLGQDRYKVMPEWAACFARLGETPEAQAVQMERVNGYLDRGEKDAKRFGLASELGLALCFDIAVQNGGIDFDSEENSIRQRLKQNPANGEIDIRLVVSEVIAENSSPKYANDVRSRKRAISTGAGTVHGAAYDVGEWGLAEAPATA